MKSYKLARYTKGQGATTTVFLHGFLASHRYWRRPQRIISKQQRTVALDLLGFGRSPKPKHVLYSYDDHLTAIKHTLQDEEITAPITLVGHSMGALLALRLAADHPEMVQRLYLFNMPLFLDRQQAYRDLASTSRLYQFILYSKWRRWFWRGIKLFPIFVIPASKGKYGHLGIMRHTFFSRDRSLKNIIEKQQSFIDLQRLTIPATLIIGRHDRYTYQQNLSLHDLPSNITVVFKESDHHFPVRHPQEAAQIITKA